MTTLSVTINASGRRRHAANWHDRRQPTMDVCRRACDILAALVGLLFLLPVMVVCGLWIKACDGGPILYRQWRVGCRGWLFPIYKLRTMRMDAETQGKACFTTQHDPRVLTGCGWMRRSHLDEVPQLWNILCGQMTLVGPRPERPEIYEEFRREIPRFTRRVAAPPGLTGLAQVAHGYTNDARGTRRKLAFDLRYLRRRSLLGDLWLIVRTLPRLWDRSAM